MQMTKKPNVLLITVDSLRADAIDLSDQNSSTPNIRRLVEKGVFFTQAFSNGPRTPSSFPAILASVYPFVSGEIGLPEGLKTWAEAMREIGYATAGFNPDNPYLTVESGYSRGFDHFVDFWSDKTSVNPKPAGAVSRWKKSIQDSIGKRSLAALLFVQALRSRTHVQYASGETITDTAIEWIRGHRSKPFFCWIHYMDVHFPYLSEKNPTFPELFRYPAAFVLSMLKLNRLPARWMRILYTRKVNLIDDLIGRWIESLSAFGMDRETLILFTSDHGERFGENGEFTHGPDLCDTLLRVPLIVSGPGCPENLTCSDQSELSDPSMREPTRNGHFQSPEPEARNLGPAAISGQVALIDLAPSIFDFLGHPPPSGFQGKWFPAEAGAGNTSTMRKQIGSSFLI